MFSVSSKKFATTKFPNKDALCIVQATQGHSTDWQTESVRIGQYYQNAVFTIAATWAPENDTGCLPKPLNPGASPNWLREWKSIQNEFPLLKRGWVMQELGLSRRILYMQPVGVFWECNSLLAPNHDPECNVGLDIFKWPYFRVLGTQWIKANLESLCVRSESHHVPPTLWHDIVNTVTLHNNHDDYWYKFVERYTRCDLTFRSDTLPALSGLCNALYGKHNSHYLAGIWSGSIRKGLAWYNDNPNSNHLVRILHNSPSWSWASYTVPINFLSTNLGSCQDSVGLDLISWSYQTVHTDPYGQISSGRIRVRAPIEHLRISSDGKAFGTKQYVPINVHCETGSSYGRGYFDTHDVECGENIMVEGILLFSELFSQRWNRMILLLEQVEGKLGEYSRLGIAIIYSSGLEDIFGVDKIREIDLV
jgi:hypothetical protein